MSNINLSVGKITPELFLEARDKMIALLKEPYKTPRERGIVVVIRDEWHPMMREALQGTIYHDVDILSPQRLPENIGDMPGPVLMLDDLHSNHFGSSMGKTDLSKVMMPITLSDAWTSGIDDMPQKVADDEFSDRRYVFRDTKGYKPLATQRKARKAQRQARKRARS